MNILESLENLQVSEECFNDIAELIECYLSEDAEDERRRKMRAAKMKEMREAAKREMKQNGGSYLENIKKIADRRNYMNTGAGKQELQHIESEGSKQENKELTKEHVSEECFNDILSIVEEVINEAKWVERHTLGDLAGIAKSVEGERASKVKRATGEGGSGAELYRLEKRRRFASNLGNLTSNTTSGKHKQKHYSSDMSVADAMKKKINFNTLKKTERKAVEPYYINLKKKLGKRKGEATVSRKEFINPPDEWKEKMTSKEATQKAKRENQQHQQEYDLRKSNREQKMSDLRSQLKKLEQEHRDDSPKSVHYFKGDPK